MEISIEFMKSCSYTSLLTIFLVNVKLKGGSGERSFEGISVSSFLSSIGLEQLIGIFQKELITMDILMETGHTELKEVGINAYGYRHRILKGVERLISSKGTCIPKRNTNKSVHSAKYMSVLK